jgi:hypothetical protein
MHLMLRRTTGVLMVTASAWHAMQCEVHTDGWRYAFAAACSTILSSKWSLIINMVFTWCLPLAPLALLVLSAAGQMGMMQQSQQRPPVLHW